MMDQSTFKSKVIDEMRDSIMQHEKREFRRDGALNGLKLCEEVDALEDFETLVFSRNKFRDEHKRELKGEEYWRYEIATGQVQFLYERMKAYRVLTGDGLREELSGRALIQARRILNGGAKGSEWDFLNREKG